MNELDRKAAKRIIPLYEEKAEAWAARRGRETRLERRWLEKFKKGMGSRATILDLGAGNGWPIAAALLQGGYHVVGIDSSDSLVREAAATLKVGEWHVADMRKYCDDRVFDGLIAWHSFFHLTPEDQRAMLHRFATFIRPGGKLMFTSGPKSGVTIGDWDGEPLFHASLSQHDYRELLDTIGFELIECKVDDPDTGGATVWLAERL